VLSKEFDRNFIQIFVSNDKINSSLYAVPHRGIYSKQKTTGSLLDSVVNKNDNIAKIILENKGLF
jgi:hypothetical protein